jgi:riboflavin kinase/FMN adenylyltransferase
LDAVRVLRDDDARGDARGAVVTIGVFDGVHRGHQAVLEQVVSAAAQRNLAATVVTFEPHPARVLDPARAPLALESLERRLARFELLGVDQVRVVNFDEAASREGAPEFVDRVLVAELRARRVIVGEDFRFGRHRAGDVATLAAIGRQRGFDVTALGAVGAPERYSSTAARALIGRGDLRGAEAVLGHRVLVAGEVVHGDARGGRELGYPTANLAALADVVRPGIGIYAAAARTADARWWPAAVSVGRRPQFYDDGAVLVEAHLAGYSGDLYGTWLDLALLEFLRGEARYDTTADLVAQIGRDVADSVEIFTNLAVAPESLLGFSPGQRR